MKTILGNHILVASFIAWAVAQLSKTIYELFRYRQLRLSRLASATGRVTGIDSAAFAISLVLAVIVMYDAAGVRRAVSIQARILNQMIDEAFQGKPFAEKRLRELIGHTPIQVFVGALLGIVIGLLVTM